MPMIHKNVAQLKRKEVSNRKIAEILSVSRNSVNRAVQEILSSGRSFCEVAQMDEEEIQEIFGREKTGKRNEDYLLPDYESLKKELAKPGVTLQLLWEEYTDRCRLSGKKGYQLTQFKKYFNDHLSKTEFKDILKHRAGESIEVDWAGDRPHWVDPDTGEIIYGWLFAGALPFSGLGFVYITPDMKEENWIKCHVKMYEYFGGSSKILIPDNLKTGILKHGKEEIVTHKTYQDMADFYGTVIIPARVRKPRDKAQAENLVLRLEQNIIGRLRNCQFFSIEEYNEAAAKELERFNNKPFQKKEGSRRELFEKYEKEALLPLPMKPYEISVFRKAKVQSNSHIAYQKNYYSVPYEYIGKEVDLKITEEKIEIRSDRSILASHTLIKGKIGQYVTVTEHMPPKSNAYGEWNSTRYLNWAKTKGPYTYEAVYRIFTSVKVEQRYYRTVHSLLKLADSYSDQRLENACRSALSILSRPLYRDIKHILETGQDLQSEEEEEKEATLFTRGGDYFG